MTQLAETTSAAPTLPIEIHARMTRGDLDVKRATELLEQLAQMVEKVQDTVHTLNGASEADIEEEQAVRWLEAVDQVEPILVKMRILYDHVENACINVAYGDPSKWIAERRLEEMGQAMVRSHDRDHDDLRTGGVRSCAEPACRAWVRLVDATDGMDDIGAVGPWVRGHVGLIAESPELLS
jgi:Ni,Fe-hydrogenase III component G